MSTFIMLYLGADSSEPLVIPFLLLEAAVLFDVCHIFVVTDVPASHCFEVRGFELAIYHDASMFPEELGQMDEGQLRGAGNE